LGGKNELEKGEGEGVDQQNGRTQGREKRIRTRGSGMKRK